MRLIRDTVVVAAPISATFADSAGRYVNVPAGMSGVLSTVLRRLSIATAIPTSVADCSSPRECHTFSLGHAAIR